MGDNRRPSVQQHRTKPKRRAWTSLKALVAVAAVVAGAVFLYPKWKSSHETPALTVRYKAGSAASAPVAQPWLEVVNTSDESVPLSDASVRYYFTADGAATYSFNCVQAAMDCSHVAAKIVSVPTPVEGADHYLDVSFSRGSGTLAPGAKSGAIGMQLFRTDGKPVDQRDDVSFNAAVTTFKPSDLLTGYLRGTRVWGNSPKGMADEASSAGASPHPAPPSGILFDTFHYSGSDDPALRAHDWLVRTSDGGPGVLSTWNKHSVTFPADSQAQGGQVLQLRASTDGTKKGTTQAEVQSRDNTFKTGTFAARIYFNDKPTEGRDGDPITEAFYMISPINSKYSELDNEYQPNGGWGAPGPRLGNVTWRRESPVDNVSRQTHTSLKGWHTVVVTAVDGKVVYSVDGKEVFTSSGRYYPRQGMSVNFNAWFVDLKAPISGSGTRTWDMKVNWFYYNSKSAESYTQVKKSVNDLYDTGSNYVNTLPSGR